MAAIATAAAAVATTEKTGLLAKQVVAAPAKEKKTKSYWEAFTDFKGNSDQLFYRSGAIRSGPSLLMLDGLRALAFLWVLVLHFSQRTKVSLGVPDAQQGVTVFFVLSGYLIAMVVASALRRSNNAFIPTYFKFLAGRFFRIWPAYIVSIICLQMYYSVLRGHGVFEACGYPGGIVRATTEYGLFLQNWLNPSHFGNDGVTALVDPTVFADKALQDKYMTMGAPGCMYKQSSVAWTVQTEVNLYFITPPLVWLYQKKPIYGWAAVLTVLALSLGARIVVAAYFEELRSDVNFFTRAFYMRANEYCFGLMTYFAVKERAARTALLPKDTVPEQKSLVSMAAETVTLAMIVCLAGIFNWHPEVFGVDPLAKWYVVYHASFYYVFTALPFGLLIYLGTGPDTKKFIAKPVYALMSSDWLYPIGALSYTGYLLQGIAMEPFVAMDGAAPTYSFSHFANMFGMIVLCCFIAFVLSMLVERPYMSIGRDVIANFEPTTKNKALVGVGFAMVVGLSVGLMVAGAPDGPLAPPVPVKTF